MELLIIGIVLTGLSGIGVIVGLCSQKLAFIGGWSGIGCIVGVVLLVISAITL